MIRNIVKISKSAVLIFVKGEKKSTMAIIDFGGESGLAVDKVGGFRQTFKNEPIEEEGEDGEKRQEKVLETARSGFS